MNYYSQLLESYSLLKKRQLRIIVEGLKGYAAVIQSNPNLEQPIAAEMQQMTGISHEDEGPANIEAMKPLLQAQSVQTGPPGEDGMPQMGEFYVAKGDSGPITIITVKGNFDRQGWKILQSQVARKLESQNPDMQNAYKSSGRSIEEDPLHSDTARTEEERLQSETTARQIRIMSETTLPNLIATGFAGDPGRITKEDSDAPGWVKDPKNHLDSYAPQSLWSKVTNEKVEEIAKIIEKDGGKFEGTRANWEDKLEGVTSMHMFAQKCMKLQQDLNGAKGTFTDNDARWVHNNVIIDEENNKVRYTAGEYETYGISFDHTTTARSKQKETMSVGLARIYNEKIKDWLEERNKGFEGDDKMSSEQFEVPKKQLTPTQIKNAKWCSDFRGKQTEKIVGFVPQIMDLAQMMAARDKGDSVLGEEINRKTETLAIEMGKMLKAGEETLRQAFEVARWNKKGTILSDDYIDGIVQTVDGLKKVGKSEKEIMKVLLRRVVGASHQFFQKVDTDFVFQSGEREGPGEKADVVAAKLDKDDYLRALEDLGIKSNARRQRILKQNKKTLREMLMIEGGKNLEEVAPENLDGALRELLKQKKLYKHLDTTYDLDSEIFTIPISLKTYVSDSDTRFGQTRRMGDTFELLMDPTKEITSDGKRKQYKKNQDPVRVGKFIKDIEKQLGVDKGDKKDEYQKMLAKFNKIATISTLIKGEEKVKGSTQANVVAAVNSLLKSESALPSLNDKFMDDYLTKNYERDKEDGREAVRLATFVERKLWEGFEKNLQTAPAEEQRAYKAMVAALTIFAGGSTDSTFGMSIDLLDRGMELYDQDECIRLQAKKMMDGKLTLDRGKSQKLDFGTMSLKLERSGNSSVFGLKSSGCEELKSKPLKEGVLQDFLKAQALLFETLL